MLGLGECEFVFDTVTENVVAWLARVVPGVEVAPSAPADALGSPAVVCHLLELARGDSRSRSLSAKSLELRYLVSVRAPDALAAHRLLGDMVKAALASAEFRIEFLTAGAPLWQALGLAPRPSFLLLVPVEIEAAGKIAPQVTEPVEIRIAPLAGLRGRVIGNGQRGIAHARVSLPDLDRSTRTDSDGWFSFAGLAPAAARRVLVEKGGRRRFAEVEGGSGPVTIELMEERA
jgi:hypothetical protein